MSDVNQKADDNTIQIGNIGQARDLIFNATPDNSPTEPPQNLPRSGVVKFVGRDTAMATLHKELQESERIAITSITGMGGIGKTELALQYGLHHDQHKTYLGGICWLTVRDQNVGLEIVNFSKAKLNLNPPDDFDLKTQVQYCWRNWKPPEGNILVIFDDVTQYQDIQDYLPPVDPRFKVIITTRLQWLGESFKQVPLEVLDEAAALELLTSLAGDRIETELETAKGLCQDLGYLPLGLELVGRYLKRKPDLSLVEMRERLKLEHRSLQKGDSKRKRREVAEDMTAKRGVKLALIYSDQGKYEQAEPLYQKALEMCQQLLGQQHPNIATSLNNLANLYKSQGKYQQAESFCKQALEMCQQLLGQQHPNIATSLDSLANLYFFQGKYEQAEPLYQKALKMRQKLLGQEHPYVAASLNNLANLYRDQGKYEQAEPLYQKALEICQQLLGQQHPNIAASLNNLANLYRDQGKYEQAKPLYQKALEICQQLLGQQHPNIATSLDNLAKLYFFQGKYEQAEPLYQKALTIAEKVLGVDHPSTKKIQENLDRLLESKSEDAGEV